MSDAAEIAREQVAYWRSSGVEITDALELLGAPGEVRTWKMVEQHIKAAWVFGMNRQAKRARKAA
jgi:hypothetical protein